VIRAARAAELSVLQEIERAALTMFVDWGRAEIGAYQPGTIEELRRHQQQGRAWVAVSAHDQPVAYLMADIVMATPTSSRFRCIHTMPAAGSGRR